MVKGFNMQVSETLTFKNSSLLSKKGETLY